MSNILQFPEHLNIQTSLEKTKDDLEEMYEALNKCFEAINALEEKIAETENTYNRQFGRYVKARGLENIEVGFIEYVSDNIRINMETGEVEYVTLKEDE